jgi:hypothetical protein
MALIKKYDSARLTAESASSPSLRIDVKMPVALSDWMSNSGKLVVLLKANAGVAQLGSLSKRVVKTPMAMDRRL